jgi:hypothetical protein
MTLKTITNILFDTSFLLNDSKDIDTIVKMLRRDGISCYISKTVRTEIEDLYYFGRITEDQYKRAIRRYKRAGTEDIEKRRNYLQESMTMECTTSMNEQHGIETKEVRNDCNILTSGLINDMDVILSEDFHFTSRNTDNVVDKVCETTCERYERMCECDILMMNRTTFLAAYRDRNVDIDIVEYMKKDIRKDI